MPEKYTSKHPFLREINQEIENIWDDYAHLDECRFTPLTFELPTNEKGELLEGVILFVGINPSFDEKHKDDAFYVYSNYGQGNRVDCAPVSYDLNTQDIQYFNAFRSVMRELNEEYKIDKPWGHLDLTFIRETNQKIVEEYYFSQNHSFIWRQVALTLKMIKHIKPSVIVVTNAFACRILSDYEDRQLKDTFDKQTGAHYLFGIPLLKSSMLSGGRSLDLGSRQRLIWHMAQILKSK